jgi:site-specific recombinase XerD
MKPTDLARHLTAFLGNYLPVQRNLSHNTIASYRDTFTLLLRYCRERHRLSPQRLRLDQLRVPMLLAFLDHLEKDRHCSPRTRNQRLAAIHAFFLYLQVETPEHMTQCQQKVTSHTFRHTKAMHLLQAGKPLTTIQAILGHADIKTCTIYASADVDMKRQALEKADHLTPTPTVPSRRSDQHLLDWLRSL